MNRRKKMILISHHHLTSFVSFLLVKDVYLFRFCLFRISFHTKNKKMEKFFIDATSLYNSLSPFNVILFILYALMVVIGLIGNCLVVIIVQKTISMRTTTNFLLSNIAVADIISLVWCIIPLATCLFAEHPKGQVGTYICKFFTGYAMTSISVSVKLSSLLIVGVERYRAVLKPLESDYRLEHINYIIGFLWIFAVILALPGFIYSEYDDQLGRCLHPGTIEKTATVKWLITSITVLTAVCSIILFLSYFYILKGIYVNKTVCVESVATRQVNMKAKRKLAITSLTVTVAYIICNAPFLVFEMYTAYTEREKIRNNYETMYTVYRVVGFIMYFNSCLNPFLYAFQSSNYRNNFKRIFLRRIIVLRNNSIN